MEIPTKMSDQDARMTNNPTNIAAYVQPKEAKFERGVAQAGPGIGLEFPFPLLQCRHTNQGG